MTARTQAATDKGKPAPKSRATGNFTGTGDGDVVRYMGRFVFTLTTASHLAC